MSDSTWLCTFSVQTDLPTTLSVIEMERIIADCLSVRLPALGYAGNVIVSLVATAGGVDVLSTFPVSATKRVDSPASKGTLPVPDPIDAQAEPLEDEVPQPVEEKQDIIPNLPLQKSDFDPLPIPNATDILP